MNRSCNNCGHYFLCAYKESLDSIIASIIDNKNSIYEAIGKYCKHYNYDSVIDNKDFIENMENKIKGLEENAKVTEKYLYAVYKRCFKCKLLYLKNKEKCPSCGETAFIG